MKFETFEYLWEQGIVPAVKNVIDEIPEKQRNGCGVKSDVSRKSLERLYNEYEFLRKQVKEKYFNEADEQHKIDACITGALLKIKLIDFKMNDKVPVSVAMSNYAVAFLASNYILYLFLLSDLERDAKDELYSKLEEQGTFLFPETNKGHDSYVQGRIKALALNDAYKNDFDILAYADMLFWIETRLPQSHWLQTVG